MNTVKTYPLIISEEMHNKLKNKCYENNDTIKDVLDRAIERYINRGDKNGKRRS